MSTVISISTGKVQSSFAALPGLGDQPLRRLPSSGWNPRPVGSFAAGPGRCGTDRSHRTGRMDVISGTAPSTARDTSRCGAYGSYEEQRLARQVLSGIGTRPKGLMTESSSPSMSRCDGGHRHDDGCSWHRKARRLRGHQTIARPAARRRTRHTLRSVATHPPMGDRSLRCCVQGHRSPSQFTRDEMDETPVAAQEWSQ